MVNFIHTSGYGSAPAIACREPVLPVSKTVDTKTPNNDFSKPRPCETCKNRKYQDQSGDSSVSYQTPTHIPPGVAASAVAAHEQEHVTRNAERAREQNMKATSIVILHSAICPECGRIYVSGGTTITTYSPKIQQSVPGEGLPKGSIINTIV